MKKETITWRPEYVIDIINNRVRSFLINYNLFITILASTPLHVVIISTFRVFLAHDLLLFIYIGCLSYVNLKVHQYAM